MNKEPDAPNGELTTRTLAMPADANPSGDIFGGWVLSQMDIAGGIAAGQRAHGRIGDRVKVTEGLFTFVAIDGDGKPTPIPQS